MLRTLADLETARPETGYTPPPCGGEEQKMRPPCPQEQDLRVLSGFSMSTTDTPAPRFLDGSVTVAVLDPTENDDRIRIVETSDPFVVEVDWCICGRLASALSGCWTVSVYMDDIDGVASFHGLLSSTTVDVASVSPRDTSGDFPDDARCYNYRFYVQAGTVGAGIYTLVVVITLATGTCANPGPVLVDTLGYAQIPVLVFFDAS
jgi:hypothetical protein